MKPKARKKNYSKNTRPFSSVALTTSGSVASNQISSMHRGFNSESSYPTKTTYSQFRQRPMTSMQDISKMNLFKNKNTRPDLDVLNLIIETSPKKYNLNKIGRKFNQINPLYKVKNPSSCYNAFPVVLGKKTEEVYYKYNILYGSNTNNLIRTYSPKMRPVSASIQSFTKSMNQMKSDDTDEVFSYEEIEALTNAKCLDLNIEVRDGMIGKFQEYCKSNCKSRYVDLSECNIGLSCTEIIGNILLTTERIARLNLSKNNIGDKGLIFLCSCIKDSHSLVSLNITSNSITPKGGAVLINMLITHKSLIDVNVSSAEGINRNRISTEGLKDIEEVLTNNPILEFFNICGNSIKNEGLKLIINGLNNNTSLHCLDVSHNDIDTLGLSACLDKLKLTKIIELNISNNPIMNEGLIKLTDSFKQFPNLRRINVSNCKIEFKGAYYLLMNLQNVKRIDTVNLSGNNIMSKNFEQLKPFFLVFGIKSLNLSNCSLGDKAAYILGECLWINESIKKIDISNNKINDKGFKSYVPLFTKNNVIESFDASRNFITDATAKDCIINMKHNRALRRVNFYDNQLRNESATEFIDVLSANKGLCYVNVGFNRVQMKLIEEINRRIKINSMKQKAKFVPNIVKEIKNLQINPEEFNIVKKKIKEEQINYNLLASKLKEDTLAYPKMKKIEENKKIALIEENKKIEEEIEVLEEQVKKLISEIKVCKGSVVKEAADLENEINDIDDEMNVMKKDKQELQNTQNKQKNEYTFELSKAKSDLQLAKRRCNEKERALRSKLALKKQKVNALTALQEAEEEQKIKRSVTSKGTIRSPLRGGMRRKSVAGVDESPSRRFSLVGARASGKKTQTSILEISPMAGNTINPDAEDAFEKQLKELDVREIKKKKTAKAAKTTKPPKAPKGSSKKTKKKAKVLEKKEDTRNIVTTNNNTITNEKNTTNTITNNTNMNTTETLPIKSVMSAEFDQVMSINSTKRLRPTTSKGRGNNLAFGKK